MKNNAIKTQRITGDLDIFVSTTEDEHDGEYISFNEVLIHGNPEGLRSLAKMLMDLADLDQEEVSDEDLPKNAREHYSLQPNIDLSKSSVTTVIGRLDAKNTREFYKRFTPRD